jgi:tRNA(fMet)-specific endonuclease VapC
VYYILDSNIISAILKNIGQIRVKYRQVLLSGGKIFIDGIIYYEIKGGLLHANATRQLRDFDRLLQEIEILWLDARDIFDTASEIYMRT